MGKHEKAETVREEFSRADAKQRSKVSVTRKKSINSRIKAPYLKSKAINIYMFMARSMFRNKTRRSLLKVKMTFRKKKHITFIFRCWKLSQARNCYEADIKHSFLGSFLNPERWRRYVLPKRRFTFNGLQGIISEKTGLFIKICVHNNFNIEVSLKLLYTTVISTENSRRNTFTYILPIQTLIVLSSPFRFSCISSFLYSLLVIKWRKRKNSHRR
jgi:hypothetical protein